MRQSRRGPSYAELGLREIGRGADVVFSLPVLPTENLCIDRLLKLAPDEARSAPGITHPVCRGGRRFAHISA